MTQLGDYAKNDLIDLKFTTVNGSGVPTQLAGSPAVAVYYDNNTAQITAGVTLTVDFDSVTGLNHVRIDTSADSNYQAGRKYQVVITAGTVGGNSVVGYVIAHFTMEFQRGNWMGLLKLDWTGLTGEAGRSVLNALRFLRNRWNISAGSLTVYAENDTTTAWTSELTNTAGANPITQSDPS
jgi:hypothetical protein